MNESITISKDDLFILFTRDINNEIAKDVSEYLIINSNRTLENFISDVMSKPISDLDKMEHFFYLIINMTIQEMVEFIYKSF